MANHVYRCYDKDLNLLYVGSSLFYQKRVECLRSHKWFDAVVFIRLSNHASKVKMLEEERSAIQSEHPKYNLMCTPKYGDYLEKMQILKDSSLSMKEKKLMVSNAVIKPTKKVAQAATNGKLVARQVRK